MFAKTTSKLFGVIGNDESATDANDAGVDGASRGEIEEEGDSNQAPLPDGPPDQGAEKDEPSSSMWLRAKTISEFELESLLQ